MFQSEMVARAIYADRVRDIERAARERRLLAPVEAPRSVAARTTSTSPSTTSRRAACGDSAGAAA